MPKRSSKKNRPTDINELAKSVVDEATSEDSQEDTEPANDGKNPAAVALGRLGGLKGGATRAANLSASKRSEIARKAARARWEKNKKREPKD